MVFLILQLICR